MTTVKSNIATIRNNFSLTKVTTLNVALLMFALSIIVFYTGISNPFMGDDHAQIVDNIPVHSISNIQLFFKGGTFYNNQGLAPLGGSFYRPMMVALYSLLYSLVGQAPIFFHMFQILLHALCAIFVFLVFRHWFKPKVSLFLALFFLVHPIDSQAVYSIPALQEPLFFFFGIVGLWILLNFKSRISLLFVAGCLLLSLLSKESGILFVAITTTYLIAFDRRRLPLFLGLIALVLSAYLALKLNAVGWAQNPNDAPIDNLSVWGRLLNVPSMLTFYFFKLIWPLALASGYYWVNNTLTLANFWLPTLLVLALALLIYGAGIYAFKHFERPQFLAFIFFSLWLVIGLALHMQIIRLDMTVAETWFYFPIVGILGMSGVFMQNFKPNISKKLTLGLAIAIIVVLAGRTSARGLDWASDYSIAQHDMATGRGNYVAETHVSIYLFEQHDFVGAKKYAGEAVGTYPNAIDYNALGQAQSVLGDYAAAAHSFRQSMKYQDIYQPYENLAALTAGYGDTTTNREFLQKAVKKFPQDPTVWMYLAILDYRYGSKSDAVMEISRAYNLSSSETVSMLYQRMKSDQPLNVSFNTNPYVN